MSDTVKIDRRIIKTKKAIRKAFAQLLSEKEISEITIKNIADVADVNRKTFYSYYAGVYEVIDEIENEIIFAFNEALRDVDFKRDVNHPYGIFKKLTAIINSDIDFYGRLMKMSHNINLISKIIQTLKRSIIQSFSEQITIDPRNLNLVVDYVVGGMVSVYQGWFHSDRAQSIEDISETISVITFSGINSLLTEKK